MSTPPPKKKRGGFFGCRSKHALDSLPRNARGENAAIHRLQAREAFQHPAMASEASTSTTVNTPSTEEKEQLKLAQLHSALSLPAEDGPEKPLYPQEEGYPEPVPQEKLEDPEEKSADEKGEERDIVPEPPQPNTSGAVRSMSVASKTGRIARSLSLKRSGSTASAKLIARAPPVSSADFADLPASSSSSSDLTAKEEASLGDMASIRKARGRHQTGTLYNHMIPDISEDLSLNDVPMPPTTFPSVAKAEREASYEGQSGSTTPLKKRAMTTSLPESDSMRAVAAALEGSTDSFRFHAGPSMGTPRIEPASPTSDHYSAEIRSQRTQGGSEDTVSDLPSARGFWDPSPPTEDFARYGRDVPFQYVTNLSRPVSIASLRSLACPSTPPRTSSRLGSPRGDTYSGPGLRSTKSFSVSPLKKQATFNGFPRTFFPASSLKHSPSTASNQSRRKAVPEPIPALDFENVHTQRQQRRLQRESEQSLRHQHPATQEGDEEGDTSAEDVDRQLAGHAPARSHTCSNCGVVEEQREFAAFVAKGKASRRTSVKQQTLKTPSVPASGSLRNRRSVKGDTIGEGTLKRWGLAEAFKSDEAGAEVKIATVKKQKKMVPGPGGGYITDTANMRWCSALDEIKKALAKDEDEDDEDEDGEEEEERVQKETQTALRQADEVLSRLGVEA